MIQLRQKSIGKKLFGKMANSFGCLGILLVIMVGSTSCDKDDKPEEPRIETDSITDVSGNVYVTSNGSQIMKINPSGVISNFAGSTQTGYLDGTGTSASFFGPRGVVLDSSGSMYVADSGNHKIRKITSAGVVTTIAGTGTQGSTDGTGTAASFNFPAGVAVDSSGNVYVADVYNHKIRKITSAGVVTTLAGAGTQGSADGTGAAASFAYPHGVAVDSSGNVYVTDIGNHKIRKITSAGEVTTLAGSGEENGSADGTGTAASFYGPSGVAVDSSGSVYVADSNNHKIRKITSTGVVTTLAGGRGYNVDGTLGGILQQTGFFGSVDGKGILASFHQPFGVAVDTSGNVYVTDSGNSKIRKITIVGN
jgi:streptogramin lyase